MALMPVADALQRVLAEARALPDEWYRSTMPLAVSLPRMSPLSAPTPSGSLCNGWICGARNRYRKSAGDT